MSYSHYRYQPIPESLRLCIVKQVTGSPESIIEKFPGSVAACFARPETTWGGKQMFESVEAKAGALFHSVISNHPLHDGNKRLAWVSAKLLLVLNGHVYCPKMSDSQKDDAIRAYCKLDPQERTVEAAISLLLLHFEKPSF